MKNLKQFVLAASFAALAVSGLHAQSVDLRAEIPFDFRAGNQLMPAGEYLIQTQGPVVWLRGADHGQPASGLLTISTESVFDSQHAHLEFNQYGHQYFLKEVWSVATRDGRQVPRTAREKELARRGEVPVQAEIILARK